MQDFDSQITHLLRQKSRFLAEGFVQGRLYDLGAYPGLVYIPEAKKQVRGEIIQLGYPDLLLPVLDDYEMIDADHPEENEYRRELVPVQSAGKTLACWTYIFQQPIDAYPEITSGDYRIYFDQNPNHQNFIDIH